MKQLLSLIPESSKFQIKKILQAYNIAIKITKKRKTKHGDFRRYTNGTSLITVNNTSNPYRFLITLLHELAHFKVSQLYPYKVKPHGLEWKSIYREILIPFLNPDIFPEPICGLLANHMKNPKASTDRDFKLIIALRQFDPSSSKTLIYQLKDGKHFTLENDRIFIKLKKRRTLFECREKSTGKIYLFSPQSEVKPIYY